MENLYQAQANIAEKINKILINFKKDSAERKTIDYCKQRIESLEAYWKEYQINHEKLTSFEETDHDYFIKYEFKSTQQTYITIKKLLNQSYDEQLLISMQQRHQQQEHQAASGSGTPESIGAKSRGTYSKADDMLRRQTINFKAFAKTIENIDISSFRDKWEFEDALQALQNRWTSVDKFHWEIMVEIEEDAAYELSYDKHERTYNAMRKALNAGMASTSFREKSTPKMEIPIFSGNFQQWISFKDLFNEAIDKNPSLSNAQKMQFLKAKVSGEAERLIQHLQISSDNYPVCWEILNNRFNNKRLIFTSYANIFLNFPNIQQQTFLSIKKLHDSIQESLHAIKNLGVDTKTWDPLLVHIISQKLDSETYSEYIESLKNSRDIPVLQDLMKFLENKFTSLETSRRKQDGLHKPQQSYQQRELPSSSRKPFQSSYNDYAKRSYYASNQQKPTLKMMHASATTRQCPLCFADHALYSCEGFLELPDENKLKMVNQLRYCINCIFDHSGNKCHSLKRCHTCNGNHHTTLHNCFAKQIPRAMTGPVCKGSPFNKNEHGAVNNKHNYSHVSQRDASEILLATAIVMVTAANGTQQPMRALIDQGSQICLISERAAQQLGLKRQQCRGVIFGVGEKENNCKGMLTITCQSIYTDFKFNANVLIMNNLIKNLPNRSFEKPNWANIAHINLADPEYYESRPVDLLLGADIYSKIMLDGIIRGQELTQPLAQQTQLGWLLCGGSVSTFQCNVVLNNMEDIQAFWKIEDIQQQNIISAKDQQYVIEQQEKLGSSKEIASAQLRSLERKFNQKEKLAEQYKQFMREYEQLGHMQLASPSEGQQKIAEINNVLMSAGFSLRKCAANNENLLENINRNQQSENTSFAFKNDNLSKTLGLRCGPIKDEFSFLYDKLDQDTLKLTKRKLLSEISKIFDPLGWSNSIVALSWKPFVANRVKKINALMPPESCHYVKSKQNPADAASRGQSPSQLKENLLWWHGPDWLSNSDFEPKHQVIYDTNLEIKKQALSIQNITQTSSIIDNLLNNYSSFNKVTRILAWILRALTPSFKQKPKYLTLQDLRKAKSVIIKHIIIQHTEFSADIDQLKRQQPLANDSKLACLTPFLDQEGISGRLRNATITEDIKHPIIIPYTSRFTKLLIDQAHECSFYGGARLTLSLLRQKYWIIKGNRATKKQYLKRVIGEQALTFEEYCNLLAAIEGTLNSRPLCSMSEDVEDLDYLTPAHFLNQRGDTTLIETAQDARTRWHLTNKIFQDIWRRWKTEYLSQLSPRPIWKKAHDNLKIGDLVTIHDDNFPAGRWPVGRVTEVHPGKDNYVRVVTLKTKNGYMKRPISKLSRLPLEEAENKQEQREGQKITQINSPASTNKAKIWKQNSTKMGNIALALIFFLSVLSPMEAAFTQQQLQNNQTFYFDTIGSMHVIRDQWKIVTYYNMAPYWQGNEAAKDFTNYLEKICDKMSELSHCHSIILQTRHDYNELQYYNQLLLNQQCDTQIRKRRGLINAVGSVANSLFGVLDQSFAEKYERDINLVQNNQKHLLNLWNNQTSIVEAEFNILKRTENTIAMGGMSRGGSGAGKTATAKRVPPPAVPGDAFGSPQHRHSGSSFGSQGYASCEDQPYPQPPDTPSHTRDDHSDYGSTVSGVSGASGSLGKSPAGGGTFTFPPPSQPLTHKAAVYYHHQLALSDDQGIDMTQSPGRDSPGSSSGSAGSGSRHSSASLDSGRASGRMPHHHHAACHCGDLADRVRAMMAQGLPDTDIIHACLAELQMEEYARLFIDAGYDLPTVTRMTPEDLTAVGIKKPNHRKRLKAELANLNVPDNLPDYIPGSLEEWLRLLRLEEYGPALVAQGYRTVHDVTQLAWEDLEDMGIVRLGHQKKILLAIKRVKDIRAGKRSISNQGSLDFTRIQTGQIRHPRGKSLESLEDPSERGSHTTFSPDAGLYYVGGQWRRSYDDGDITPTNDSSYEGGGTLPRPRGLVRPRPVAKIAATPAYRDKSPDYAYDEIAYSARLQRVAYGASPHVARKPPPEPPKRQSSQYAPFTRFGQTTVEIHPEKSLPLSLPAYPSSDSLSVSLDSTGLLPPPPAPSSPPRRYEEDKLRTGSDASFKSSSSTESDSIPFANENAGTIKQNRSQIGGRPHTVDYGRGGIGLATLPPRNDIKPTTPHALSEHKDESKSSEPVDVLNDIGNMLANLTDELDAMLEEEKRQGLADS